MNVLVIGGGGREHALAWKLAQSDLVDAVFVAPGNAGSASEPNIQNVTIDPLDFVEQLAFVEANNIKLTIVGPEQPLVDGIVDYYTERGHRCFGPTAAASQLEGSKSFTKDFLARNNIPTAAYEVFTDAEKACEYLTKGAFPIVVKADGLAAGKGVVIAESLAEAESTVRDMLAGNSFGDAGRRVVIEEFMQGEEASFIAIVDGTDVLPFASSQDHKAALNGDKGPNTGGMGAYSPAPVVTAEVHEHIMRDIMQPTVEAMAKEGNRYRGFLYAGVMIDQQGAARVVEFNCRFGDPETQPIMLRMKSDLAGLAIAAIDGDLASEVIDWDDRAAVGVVMAAGGYPGSYQKGDQITGLDKVDAAAKVFHAGTKTSSDGGIETCGGRVLCVTALGESVAAAQQTCYDGVERIHWNQVQFRTDIAYRAIRREQELNC
ncbi:MAG: phosphoribosylamine--glycine ligase [Pseudomonadales bacterium]